MPSKNVARFGHQVTFALSKYCSECFSPCLMQGQQHGCSLDPQQQPKQSYCPDILDNTRKWPQCFLLPSCMPSSWIRKTEFSVLSSSRKTWSPGSQPLANHQPSLAAAAPPPSTAESSARCYVRLDAGKGSRSSGWYLSALNTSCLWNPSIFSLHAFQILQLMRLGPYTQ